MKIINRVIKSFMNNKVDKAYFGLVIVILSLSFILSFLLLNYSNGVIENLENNVNPIVALKSIYNEVKYQPANSSNKYNLKYEEAKGLVNDHIAYVDYLDNKYNSIYTSLNAYNAQDAVNLVGYDDELGFMISSIEEKEEFNDNTSMFVDSYNRFLNRITLTSERNETPTKVYFENAKITKGRSFTKAELESGTNVIILPSDSVKYKNAKDDIEVGDTVNFDLLSNGYNGLNLENGAFRNHKNYEFEVIGFMEADSFTSQDFIEALIPEKLYLEIIDEATQLVARENPYYFFLGSARSSLYDINKYNTFNLMKFFPTTLKLNNVSDLENLYAEIKEYNNQNGMTYELESNLSDYLYLETSFTMMKTILVYVVIFSIIFSTIIFIMVIINDLKKRKKEIGILIALGESKTAVILQMWLEYILISIISVLIAIVLSLPISNLMIDKIYSSYDKTSINETYVENKLGSSDVTKIVGIEVIITTIALVPSVILINKYKPKEILEGE